ncbi:MAG: FAD-dependent oxidoreductase, partial [Actinobacteria bacterium]|nr:FAD-dependent oxidoreductase [Actinomycetota bacterium]
MTPVPPERRSLWLEEALALSNEESCPPLQGEVRADVCIVGGGYAGLWTALRLLELEPSLEVAIVEADVCGGGASGRNGGFVLSWWAKIGTLVKLLGPEEGRRLASASADSVGEIGRFCEAHAIDAGYRADGWLWSATSPAQVGAWEETVSAAESLGESPFRPLGREEMERLSGSPVQLAGVFEETAASVQPALLARGLRRVALEHGVRIFEGSPMTALERSRPPRVRTPSGAVVADTVILAMNAWIAQFRELRRSLVVIASDMVATEPIPERLMELGLASGLCVSDARLLVNYYRRTDDGRIAWGKGGGGLAFGGRVGTRFDGSSPRAKAVAADLRRIYPQLGDTRITHSWTGPIDRTPTALPYIGRLEGRDDLHYVYGFSGNGVGPAHLTARIVASRVLRRDDEWAATRLPERPSGLFPRSKVGAFPPEPFR